MLPLWILPRPCPLPRPQYCFTATSALDIPACTEYVVISVFSINIDFVSSDNGISNIVQRVHISIQVGV